jgi:hypothetical protein
MQSFHLQGFEVERIRKDLKIESSGKMEGFEVQRDYLKVYRVRHTCELLHPLNKLDDLFLSSA